MDPKSKGNGDGGQKDQVPNSMEWGSFKLEEVQNKSQGSQQSKNSQNRQNMKKGNKKKQEQVRQYSILEFSFLEARQK